MECVNGEDLRHWIKRRREEGILTFETILPVIRQIAEALDYAHSENIIHRDVKPGNIMIDPAGKAKVLDFGLAAQIRTSMTNVSRASRGTSGTAPYMAPEQWKGKVQGAAADQYALAAMTYEMLAGHPPFTAADPAVLQQAVLTQTPDAPPNLSTPRWNALRRALEREPADRFPDCAAFVAALESSAQERPNRISPAIVWGVPVLLVLVAVAFFLFQSPLKQSGAEPPAATVVKTMKTTEKEPFPAAIPAAPEKGPSAVAVSATAVVPPPPFHLKCGTVSGRSVFREGEEVSLTVESDRPCYLLVFVRQPDDSEVVLFPNPYNSDTKIPAGVPVEIPGADKPGFQIVAAPPFGTDEIHFVACTAESPIFRKAKELARRETDHFAVTRGLRLEAEKFVAASSPTADSDIRWANATMTITTKAK